MAGGQSLKNLKHTWKLVSTSRQTCVLTSHPLSALKIRKEGVPPQPVNLSVVSFAIRRLDRAIFGVLPIFQRKLSSRSGWLSMSQQRTTLSSFLLLDPPRYELPLSSSIARSGFSGWAFMKSLCDRDFTGGGAWPFFKYPFVP